MIQSAVAGRNGGNGGKDAVMETDQAVEIFQTPIMATLIIRGSLSPYPLPSFLASSHLPLFRFSLILVELILDFSTFHSGYVWITFADKVKTLTGICRSPSLIEIPLRNSQEEFY